MAMPVILLTGVNGFLGNYLTPLLLLHGYKVVGIGRGVCRLNVDSPHFSYLSVDIADENALEEAMKKLRPDVIIHAAANSMPDACETDKEAAYQVNVTSTRRLLQLAERNRSHFVYISTDFVFDGKTGKYKEEDPLAPVNYYGTTKALAEKLVAAYPYSQCIIRTVLVYGKPLAGRQNILSRVHEALKNNRPFRLVHDQYRTPTYVKDLAWGITEIVRLSKSGIWHIAGEGMCTPYEMGITMAHICHLPEHLLQPVTHETFQEMALRPRITGLNIEKAKKELGFCPVPFEKAIREIFPDECHLF